MPSGIGVGGVMMLGAGGMMAIMPIYGLPITHRARDGVPCARFAQQAFRRLVHLLMRECPTASRAPFHHCDAAVRRRRRFLHRFRGGGCALLVAGMTEDQPLLI